jgi:hypothetical protein
MKKKEVFELKEGDKINHKHYRVCVIKEVIPEFGPVIIPESCEGLVKLKNDADTVEMFRTYPIGTPHLETSYRLILNKI